MKYSGIVISGFFACSALTTPVLAGDDEGFYVGVQGGINLLSSENYQGAVGTHNVKFSYDTGWAAGLVFGYDFGKFSTELEFTRRKSSIDTLTVVTDGGLGAALGTGPLGGALSSPTGNVSTNSYMWNVYYRFSPEKRTTPFVGVGVGISSIKLLNIAGGGLPAMVANQTDESFTAQAIAGIRHKVSDAVSLVLSYRYTYMNKVQFNLASTLPVNGQLNNHTFMVGIIIKFGGKKEAPVTPPPPPPPPVVVAPPPPPPPEPEVIPEPVTIPGPFIVFFDWNSDELDSQAMSVLRAAAAAFQEFGIARISEAGYTDSSGSDDYNDDLSQRRAKAVAAALVGLGISANVINTSWHGENDQRVATGDGVRERQNRRVEITLVE